VTEARRFPPLARSFTTADGLLLILVGACGAFVAVLRNHAEIVLATLIVNLRILRRSRSRRTLIRSADVAMVVALRLGMVQANPSQGVNGLTGSIRSTGSEWGVGQGGEWAMQGRPAGA
jgi:hypothetical protein